MLKMAGGFKMMDVTKVELFRSKDWLDERAFEAIFQERYTKVYAVLFRLIGDRYEADDLTAETFWRLWEHPPARDENIAGWLYRVAMRLGYNALRDNRRREHYEENAARDAIREALGDFTLDDPLQETEQRQEREFVRALLRQMPFRDVQVLVLRHSGLSYKEIAAVVDVSVSSVGTLLTRAESKFEALYRRGVKDAPKR
jgi:RNA polymerase sigma-70 factor (ECF subfamily)